MKHRVKLAACTLLITMAGLGMMVIQNWRDTTRTIVVNLPPGTTMSNIAPLAPLLEATPAAQPTAVLPIATDVPAEQTPAISTDAAVMHTAVAGETVSGLASGLRNKETKTYVDAIVNANPSLKADPDKLVAGQTYIIPAAANLPTDATSPKPPAAAVDATPAATVEAPAAVIAPAATAIEPTPPAAAPADAPSVLHYTAKPGDTVTNMAGAFLGSQDQAHQDTITNANPSLKTDPDHVVAGKKYTIPVTEDGLSAAPVVVKTDVRPAVQPEADQMIKPVVAKTLTYTAKPGDTVTSMAIALLGSDTPAARDAIINSNPSLKRDADKVIAGQTYSIPAPIAELDPR